MRYDVYVCAFMRYELVILRYTNGILIWRFKMIQLVQERLLDVLEAAMSQHRPFNHPGIDISRTPSRMVVSELWRYANAKGYSGRMTVTFH